MPKVLSLYLLLGLACGPVIAQDRESVLDRIEDSIPRAEAGWKLVKDSAYMRTESDHPQAALVWTNGRDEVSAYVVVYKSLRTAKGVFERDFKGGKEERRSELAGVGEAAYLWKPEKDKGSYIVRFSAANVIVLMSSESEEVVKRCAKYIAESISPSGN